MDSIISDSSTAVLVSKWRKQHPDMPLELFETMAKELRKQLARSISLVESGIAQSEDVIDLP